MRGPIFLVGFPGAGKSTVGRALAAALTLPFCDLDDELARRGGCAIADLIAADEPAFRELEAATLRDFFRETAVIATGGGAATAEAMAAMRAAGLVIALGVTPTIARARHAARPHPMLARPAVEVDALWQQRVPAYREAHVWIETTDRTITSVCERAERAALAWHTLADGDLVALLVGERETPIWTAPGFGPHATPLLRLPEQFVCVADAAVVRLHHELLAPWNPIALPPESLTKTWRNAEQLSAELAGRLDRGGGVLAVGGGATTDLVGFVAATLYRGVPVTHVPTTLVGMVDAAIGGKTGLDSAYGKNTTGVFWPPRAVLLSAQFLRTLPHAELAAGFGELWKTAVLAGGRLWQQTELAAAALAANAPPPDVLMMAVQRAARYKANIVAADERETTGLRMLLNLGHTVGHAIEQVHQLPHGVAVGLGLVAAGHVADQLSGNSQMRAQLATALAPALPCDLATYINADVLARLSLDKKRRVDYLHFVVPWAIGRCEVVPLPVRELVTILASV